MKTFQDLLKIGDDEKSRMDFCRSAINDYITSEFYKTAKIAEQYDKHRNVTINQFKKIVYNATGEKIEDIWSPNYKMACRHFHRFITQENQFLLGNGVSWGKADTAKRLGNKKHPFDIQLQNLGHKALWGGVAHGFFNLDHIDVFSALEYVSLPDEENGAFRAGIRFWQIDEKKPQRMTLYEEDGYTDYIKCGADFELSDGWVRISETEAYKPKRTYKLTVKKTAAGDVEITNGGNYLNFPIVPLWGNEEHQSEIAGKREQIDCYDLIKSGFANTVDDASMMYWVIQGANGMDEADLNEFVNKVRALKAVNLPRGTEAVANTVNLPYQASEALLDRLDKDLYRDAMALDTENIANGATTATQIRAAYEPLNSKCDSFEFCVLEFIQNILELAGIEDEATFTRSMIVNTAEEVQTTIQAAPYMAEDDVTKRIYELMGMTDKAEEALNKIQADNYNRFGNEEDETE